MAGFNFFLSSTEQKAFVTYLFEIRAQFVPVLRYETPHLTRLASVSQVHAMIESDRLVGPILLIWENEESYPLEFYRIEKDGITSFFIKQRHGGPYIDFLPCRTRLQGNKPYLISGSIGYYPMYVSEGLSQELPIPMKLKNEYKKITDYVRSISVKTTTEHKKRSYWIGKEALYLIENGATTNVDHLILPE